MMRNLLREKLGKGEIAFGALIEEPATQIAEILGLLGFDYLYIDCQHSPMSLESVAQLTISARRGENPKQYIEKGFNMITKSLSTLVVEACHQFLEQARG